MKILLVEDGPGIAEFVVHGLTAQGYEVEHALDGIEGLKKARAPELDLIILDGMLPGMDGLDVLQQLRLEGIKTPVIMLSARTDLPNRLKGFELGADDYLPKPFFIEELVARIKVLMGRRVAPSTQLLQVGDLSLNLVSRRVYWHEVSASLSPREFSLLEYLMQSPGQIFSRKKILAHVWQIDFDPETNVVDVCVQRLKRKLSRSENENTLPIESVRGVGYRIRSD
jgi:DNA-binding response OmpR family regulator